MASRGPTRVKNKTPAPIQITAAQILRESHELHDSTIQRQPKQKLIDQAELADYCFTKRKEFEDRIRRDKSNKNVWVRYAEFEESQKDFDRARSIWERALDVDYRDQTMWLKYADMELKNRFKNRARNVLERAVALLPAITFSIKDHTEGAIKEGAILEDGLEKRRLVYEEKLTKNPWNYDDWLDYLGLENSKERIREIYERAVANLPPASEKKYWHRYIYLWINYALDEELDELDVDRTRDVYKRCLKLIPHGKFSFSKIWIMAAEFEIRQLNLNRARLILGNAIGRAPTDKIFKWYIELEMILGNKDRCRKLYEKYLEWAPEKCSTWIEYAEFEKELNQTERVRAIFELGISQPVLDMPELLWKAYIDFEDSEGELENAKDLYERLLDSSKHLKVWISYARFEASIMDNECIDRVRRVFESGLDYLRTSAPEQKEERAMLLKEWMNMEKKFGENGNVNLVISKLPKKIRKRQIIELEDGFSRQEDYYIDYLFPEEIKHQISRFWKKRITGRN